MALDTPLVESDEEKLARGRIESTLRLGRGDKINLCFQIFNFIKSVSRERQPPVFQFTCEIFDGIESSEELDVPIKISENEKETLLKSMAV